MTMIPRSRQVGLSILSTPVPLREMHRRLGHWRSKDRGSEPVRITVEMGEETVRKVKDATERGRLRGEE